MRRSFGSSWVWLAILGEVACDGTEVAFIDGNRSPSHDGAAGAGGSNVDGSAEVAIDVASPRPGDSSASDGPDASHEAEVQHDADTRHDADAAIDARPEGA